MTHATALDLLVAGERAYDLVYEIQRLDGDEWSVVTKPNYRGEPIIVRYRTLRKAREQVPTDPGEYRIVNLVNGAAYTPA